MTALLVPRLCLGTLLGGSASRLGTAMTLSIARKMRSVPAGPAPTHGAAPFTRGAVAVTQEGDNRVVGRYAMGSGRFPFPF
jgi:hypothetical protein